MSEYLTHRELEEALEDERMERGILLQQTREDWRHEIDLVLGKFKNEMRLLIALAVVILKFHVSMPVTGAAVGLVVVKAAVGFFRL